MYNPWAKWRISCDWECHLARGSAGGIDYAVSNGTPIRAAFAGALRNRTTGNLYTAILTADHNPKLGFYHLHLSRYAPSGHYNEGDIIGWTGGIKGAVGSGTSTGPHLHVNAYLSGVIRNVTDFFSGTAGLDPQPLPITGEPTMEYTIIRNTATGQGALVAPWIKNNFHEFAPGEYAAFVVFVNEHNAKLPAERKWPLPPEEGNPAGFANFDDYGYNLFRSWIEETPTPTPAQEVNVSELVTEVLDRLATHYTVTLEKQGN